MSIEQKQLAIRLALADIGYLVRDNVGRIITPPKTRSDRVELSLLQSRKIVRLHDDFARYIESVAA